MNVFLRQLHLEGTGPQAWLRAGQFVTLGASPRADFQLVGDTSLPPICARLEVRSRDCVISHIAPGQTLISVAAKPTVTSVLRSGDKIRIGQSELEVVWEPSIKEADSTAPAIVRTYQQKTNEAKIPEWGPTLPGRWPMRQLLVQVPADLNSFLLVNGTAAGSHLSDMVSAEADLFVTAPPEVRAENSLHLLADRSFDDLWDVYHRAHDCDAAIWAFSYESPSTILAKAQPYLAWFAKPSILQLNLRHGSSMFLEGLFRPFVGFCFRPTGGDDWVLFARPGTKPHEFGLPTLE